MNEQRRLNRQMNLEQHEQVPPDSAGRAWVIFCHLGALSVYFGVPLGNILVPLVIWLIKKDELPAVDEHGKHSLNFQISYTMYTFLASFAVVLVAFTAYIVGGDYSPFAVLVFISLLLIFLILAHLALTIVAAIKAGQGTAYRYPLAIRFLK